MDNTNNYEVIIIGGSYSGLAAAMALGRALRKVLVIDSGLPCNRQTPYSHNFLTQDGVPPATINAIAKEQVSLYTSVTFENGIAASVKKLEKGFEIVTQNGQVYKASKLILASGIRDIMPAIEGFSEIWGISILHCPYCHGYEVKNLPTGILANGAMGVELAKLLLNWTKNVTIFTNGKHAFTQEQIELLTKWNCKIEERAILKIEHQNGQIEDIVLEDGSRQSMKALYTRLPFIQHSSIPEQLGCAFTEEGYIYTDPMQKTSIYGVFACGDNSSRMRTVANAVSSGTSAGIMLNKELIDESYL